MVAFLCTVIVYPYWGKATLWVLATRMSFIIAGPGIPSDVVCDKPVELLSIYPTVMVYAVFYFPPFWKKKDMGYEH